MTEKLCRLQRELRVVQRAAWLLGLLIAVAGASLTFPAILVQNFSYSGQEPVMNIVLALFAGLSICLVAFIILGIFLYVKLHREREACRQRLRRLFATRLDSAQ
jgi:hypothetical protein